jgi:hypothetical protein
MNTSVGLNPNKYALSQELITYRNRITAIETTSTFCPRVYKLTGNDDTEGWYYLGAYKTSYGNDDNSDLKIEFVSHSYFNDTNSSQDALTILRFKVR